MAGTAVTPTGADLDGVVIAAIASGAHTSGGAGIANDISALILQTLTVPGSAQTVLTVLTDPGFTGSTGTITAAAFPQQFLAIRLFDKLAVLVRALRFVVVDLSWLLSSAAIYGGIDLTQLPATTAQPAQPLQPLLTTLLLIKLARLWTAAPPSSAIQTLYDVIGGVHSGSLADDAAAQSALATITGWPLSDITAFAAALALTFTADYTNPTAYDALRTLEQMASAAHATGAQLIELGPGAGRRANRRGDRRGRAGRAEGAAVGDRGLARARADDDGPDPRSPLSGASGVPDRPAGRLGRSHLRRRRRALRLLPDRRRHELLPADLAHRAGLHRGPDLRRAVPDEPGDDDVELHGGRRRDPPPTTPGISGSGCSATGSGRRTARSSCIPRTG